MDQEQNNKYDLIEQFTRIEWLLHRYHQQNHTQHGPMGEPRRGQGRVLAILKMKPEISQKDLTYLLDIRQQSLGELLSKLEKNGYITRTPSEADRRVMNIQLTKEGAEASEQEFPFDKPFVCLSNEEQRNLGNYLSRIIETIGAQLRDEQPERDFDLRLQRDHPFSSFGPRFPGRGFGPRRGMEKGHPGNEDYDPRLERGWGRPRRFGHYPKED